MITPQIEKYMNKVRNRKIVQIDNCLVEVSTRKDGNGDDQRNVAE